MQSIWCVLAVLLLSVWVQSSSAAAEENPLRLIRHERASILIDDSIEVHVSPQLLNMSKRGWVTVNWTNVPDPSKDDWIGLWPLATPSSSIDPKEQAPVRYQFCSTVDSHLKSGSGQLKFYLVNMRRTFQFALIRGGFKKPVLAAHSEQTVFKNLLEPLYGHLSLTKNPTEMMLTFSTLKNDNPQVKWGTESGHYTKSKHANSTTYTPSDMCDSPAKDYGFISPDTINTAVMDGLSPGVKYYYIFGSDGSGGYSEEHNFTAPPVSGPTVTTKILAYGDLGHGAMDGNKEILSDETPSLLTTKGLVAEADGHDFVMHIGDISYAEGFAGTWEYFFDQMDPLMAQLPYMVNTGNHESDSKNSNAFYQGHDSGGECNIPYTKRFTMPRDSTDEPWYGFDYGSVHVIMMSTEHDFRNSSKQLSTLTKLFEAVNRTRTPWLIFSGHRPMYCDSTNAGGPTSDQAVAILLRQHVEPLLMQYKVDLALWGHHHSYQRTCPVFNEKCTDNAPVHVIIGMAGQGLSRNLKPIKPSYTKVIDVDHYGYTRMTANATTLAMEYIRNQDGSRGDYFTLTKPELQH